MSDTDAARLVRIETLLVGIVSRDDDHEMRIRKLERALFIGMGAAAALGSAVGSFMGRILPMIGV